MGLGQGQGEGGGQGGGEGAGQGRGAASDTRRLISLILCLFLPPAGVFLVDGCGIALLLNILLCLLCVIPGIIHAFYVVLKSGN